MSCLTEFSINPNLLLIYEFIQAQLLHKSWWSPSLGRCWFAADCSKTTPRLTSETKYQYIILIIMPSHWTNILRLINNFSLDQKFSLAKMRSVYSIICNMCRKYFQSLRTSVTKQLLKCVYFHPSNHHVVARGWALWINNRYYLKVLTNR